jgi:signal transduction histidine kinase
MTSPPHAPEMRDPRWSNPRLHASDSAGWRTTASACDVALSRVDAAPQRSPEPVVAPSVDGKNAFLAAAVHDLKNQLGVIRGTSQLLERHVRRASPLEPERLLTGLAEIQRSTAKMNKLIAEFFDLSRLQSGQAVEFNRQPMDLVLVVGDCIRDYTPTTSHTLTMSSAETQLLGIWDGARLERVLENLLSNASKYSAPDTTIRITVARDDSGSQATAVLTVQDQGIGIPLHDLPQIFAPFYRGSNVARQTLGTGIGLYGARANVEQQGGTLELESTEGRGTTVTVRLPLTDESARPSRRV